VQPAPAPRYSVTKTDAPRPPREAGADADAILSGLGADAGEIAALRARGVFA
jgi:alpha-methylacyl-CoA racemase